MLAALFNISLLITIIYSLFSSISRGASFLSTPTFYWKRMSKHSASSQLTPPKAKHPKLGSPTAEAGAQEQPYKIYCDLDGVLCDFNAGVQKICGRSPDDLNFSHMWSIVAGADSFYEHLPWMSDGKELWNAIRHLSPDILTGVPRHWSAREEKAEWCRRELGVPTNHVDMAGYQRSHHVVEGRKKEGDVVNVITCWSRNKHMESGVRCVLIDDRENQAKEWEMRGGIFVHHTSTERTLRELRERGILSEASDGSGNTDEVSMSQCCLECILRWCFS
jgi:hypothetical protein